MNRHTGKHGAGLLAMATNLLAADKPAPQAGGLSVRASGLEAGR